jgi:hypothetical protein
VLLYGDGALFHHLVDGGLGLRLRLLHLHGV